MANLMGTLSPGGRLTGNVQQKQLSGKFQTATKGDKGDPGSPAYCTVEQTDNDVIVTATDANGTTTATIHNRPVRRYNKRADFPSLGEDNVLYMDMEEETGYIWNPDTLGYVAVASDWHNIKVIDGGNA